MLPGITRFVMEIIRPVEDIEFLVETQTDERKKKQIENCVFSTAQFR